VAVASAGLYTNLRVRTDPGKSWKKAKDLKTPGKSPGILK